MWNICRCHFLFISRVCLRVVVDCNTIDLSLLLFSPLSHALSLIGIFI